MPVQERLAEIYPLNRGASSAEVRQAEYFSQVLGRQRSEILDELEQCRVALAEHRENGDLANVTRLRRIVRAKESELNTVDRLLEGLEFRFRPTTRRP